MELRVPFHHLGYKKRLELGCSVPQVVEFLVSYQLFDFSIYDNFFQEYCLLLKDIAKEKGPPLLYGNHFLLLSIASVRLEQF